MGCKVQYWRADHRRCYFGVSMTRPILLHVQSRYEYVLQVENTFSAAWLAKNSSEPPCFSGFFSEPKNWCNGFAKCFITKLISRHGMQSNFIQFGINYKQAFRLLKLKIIWEKSFKRKITWKDHWFTVTISRKKWMTLRLVWYFASSQLI